MPYSNSMIKLTPKFHKLDIETLNVQPKCKFLLRCMRSIKKDKNNQFKYNRLVNFMKKNKDNKLYYRGNGITSVKNLHFYWNYAHSHKTAFIPDFNKMYKITLPVIKKRKIPIQHKPRIITIKITI